ncbi:MAG: polymer-forming cytoskeletal protein [Desulfonauticus sp.]|nr:polymer-forming cytoskeletal protein [Desulfonauticus sp.]
MAKNEFNAFLGKGTHYEGKLIFEGTVRLDGNFLGQIDSGGTLVVGQEADVQGTIHVDQLIVSGKIEGKVKVQTKAVFYKGAVFIGDLDTNILVVEEGARVQGRVNMGDLKKENQEEKIGEEAM